MRLEDILNRLKAKISNRLFFAYKVFQVYFFSKRKMRILFSDRQEWKNNIKRGFQFTRHEIAFEEFTPESIKNYDLVVPLTMPDLKCLSGELRNLVINNPIPIPSMESIKLCDDKYLFNQKLIENGFEKFIPKMSGTLKYPYILKKRVDEWGSNSYIIFDKQQEQSFSDSIANPEYFCQELVMGRYQYATHILIKNQKILCSISVKHIFKTDTPVQGKDKPLVGCFEIHECPYLELFSSILTTIGFEGLCCIDYKVVENRPLIFEINPRLGGTLCKFFFSFLRYID